MPTSEARIQANRRNAALSTGPRTTEGKERSRANALKHGMTGAGVVASEENHDEVARRREELQDELRPSSTLGAIMVRQMAALSVRMERSVQQESAAIRERVRHAAEDFDEARLDEAERLFGLLEEQPRVAFRKLLGSPEGVDRLIEAWQELRTGLTCDDRPTWTAPNLATAANLCGLRVEEARGLRIVRLSRAIGEDVAGSPELRSQLVEQVEAEIASLEEHRETLDFEAIERDRAEAGDRALFDPSKEATLARRYESEARRGFFKALKEFRQAEEEAVEPAETAEASVPEVVPAVEPLASFRETPPTRFRGPQPASTRSDESRPCPILDHDGQPLRADRPVSKVG